MGLKAQTFNSLFFPLSKYARALRRRAKAFLRRALTVRRRAIAFRRDAKALQKRALAARRDALTVSIHAKALRSNVHTVLRDVLLIRTTTLIYLTHNPEMIMANSTLRTEGVMRFK